MADCRVRRIKLGSQGLEVSAQGLGCMSLSAFFGVPEPKTDPIALLHHAIDSGVTFLDTADSYGPKTNELLLAKALKDGVRERVELASKFGIIYGEGKREIKGDPLYVRAACEASLKRLDVDCIDLYYQHRIDARVPIEITMGELKKLVEEGKIKYIGLSEASASTIRRAHAVHPITAVQLEWSLWSRDVEEEVIPTCRELGIGIVAYSPLGRGFFASGPKLLDKIENNDYRKFMQVEINSGSTTSFWFDNWSPLGRLIELTGERGCIALGIPLHTTVERAIQMYRSRLHRVPVFRMIEQEVMKLKERGMNLMEDVCLWKRENGDFKSNFITAQTWDLIRVHSVKVQWSKGIWIKEATPKFAFITWIAVRNRLATGDRIFRWNPQAVAVCWLCKEELETRDHLFFDCKYSKEVWSETIGSLAGSVCIHGWERVMQVVVNGVQDRLSTCLLRYCFQAVIYVLWMERNTRRVGEPLKPVGCLIARLETMVKNRITSLRKKEGAKYVQMMEIWFGRK